MRIITSFARCGSEIFLSDTQHRVHRLDATVSPTTLRLFAADEEGIARPSALAADCDRGRLYVVNAGSRTVVTLDTRSGAVLKTQPFKRELYEARFAHGVHLRGMPNPGDSCAVTLADPAR